jgi:hypothetical protein
MSDSNNACKNYKTLLRAIQSSMYRILESQRSPRSLTQYLPLPSVALELRQQNTNLVDEISDVYRDYDGSYEGLSFRPSTYKKDSTLRFIPINLHVQLMRIAYSSSFAAATVIDTITFGAPAAYLHRYALTTRPRRQ